MLLSPDTSRGGRAFMMRVHVIALGETQLRMIIPTSSVDVE